VAERNRRLARILLVLTGVPLAVVGLWATLAPRSFYDNFPGFGRHWVDVDGPYNEHLVRDVGHLELAVAFVVFAAVFFGGRQLMQVAAVAAIVTGLPHATYHALNREGYETGDLIASVGGLVLGVLMPVAVLYLTWPRATTEEPTPSGASGARQ
jgi:hypothetical protein